MFPGNIVSGLGVKENRSKLLDSLIFSNSLFQHIIVPTRTNTPYPLTYPAVDFLKCKTLFRLLLFKLTASP